MRNANVSSTIARRLLSFILLCALFAPLLTPTLQSQLVAAAPASATINTNVLNLRNGPGTTYGVITRMYSGETVSIYAGPSNGWYKVVYGSAVGWASGAYLAIGANTPTGTATIDTDVLNLRTGRGTGFTRLTRMYEGESVQILAGPTDGWYQVFYKNITGWAMGDYLALATAELPETATIDTNLLNLRSGPGTGYNSISKMRFGETVVITGQSGVWYEITYHGQYGWAHGDYLSLGGDSWSFWVPTHQQEYTLSCEYASLQIATEALGNKIPEDDFIDIVGFANNPHDGFRGNIDGVYYSTDDYGVYPEPLPAALAEFGFTGETFYGDAQVLKNHLRAGHPVLLFIDQADGYDSSFQMDIDGEKVTMSIYSHVVVAYGYSDEGVLISDPDSSVRKRLVPWSDLLAMWSSMDQMALAVSN